MKHLKLFEEFGFAEFGSANRDLKKEPPLEKETFVIPGFVKTNLDENVPIRLEPGDIVTIEDYMPGGRGRTTRKILPGKGIVTFSVQKKNGRKERREYECTLDSFIEILTYDTITTRAQSYLSSK